MESLRQKKFGAINMGFEKSKWCDGTDRQASLSEFGKSEKNGILKVHGEQTVPISSAESQK